MPDLIVTLVQSDLAWEDVDANLAAFDVKIEQVVESTDLIVLPEMFSTGFSMDAVNLAEPMEGKTVSWMRTKAAQKKAVVAGSVIIEDQGHFYNRLIWAQPDGCVATYDKKHLFGYAGEDKVYQAGQSRFSLELVGWRIRPFICYDLRFPIWTRNLDLVYDLAIFSANWPARRSAHWRALLIARAIENQAYVIGVNRVGGDGNGLEHDGHSTVIAPSGDVLFEAGKDEITHTISLDRHHLDAYREQFPFWRDWDSDMVKLI